MPKNGNRRAAVLTSLENISPPTWRQSTLRLKNQNKLRKVTTPNVSDNIATAPQPDALGNVLPKLATTAKASASTLIALSTPEAKGGNRYFKL